MNETVNISTTSQRTKQITIIANRAFLYLWIGQLVSLLGDHVYRVGITWSGTQVGGVLGAVSVGIAMSLPMAILGIFAGVIVDRSDRFKLLIITDIVRAVIVSIITLLFLSPSANFVLICAGAVILAIASLLFTPAIQATLPELAQGNRDKLIQMDGWILGTMSTLGVVGPAIAGALLYWAPAVWLIGFDAFSFIFSAFMLFLMRNELLKSKEKATEPRPVRGSFLNNAKEGLAFLVKHPVLRPQFTTFPFMESASYAVPFLLPAFVHGNLKDDSTLYGLLLGSWALGRVLGMTIVSRTKLKQNRGKVLMLNFILQGLALLTFTLVPFKPISILCFIMLGLPGGASQISISSYIQMEIPPQIRGRVFAALTSLVTWLTPLGPLMLGLIAQWKGAQTSLFVVAAIFILGGAYIASHRAVREVK